MNAAERRLITYTAAAHAVVHITELTYPALLTRIGDDFGVRAVILGTIASVFSWAVGGRSLPPGGPLPDGPGGAAARPGARVPRRLRQRRSGAGARPGRRPGDSRRLAAGGSRSP